MTNEEHIALLRRSVKRWNAWRQEHPDVRPDLRSVDLIGADLRGAHLGEANLSEANLSQADLTQAHLTQARLSTADLREADLREAHLREADLRGADLRGTHLSRADLREADLRGAHLTQADLSTADLSGADLSAAHLTRADLSAAYLSTANLTGANLTGANFTGAHLTGANLTGANFSAANLSEANLSEANLSQADLRGANLSEANLSEANLSQADLTQAHLTGAHLTGAHLTGAHLGDADLNNVRLWNTTFTNNDLSTARGLLDINHNGPSPITLYSVKLPQDGSALHFLRGAGVPDEWIDVYRTTVMHPIQYHSVFISYSSKDDLLARRLHADLQDQGVRCWFAPHDMKIGDKIRARIDEAIQVHDKSLLILSRHALASTWVEDEVEAALEREQQQHREILFPVRLDESVMRTNMAWAAKLRRTRHIGNLSHWTDPETYQDAFKRLLRDLKSDTQQGGTPGG